jgi:hypothetical protein
VAAEPLWKEDIRPANPRRAGSLGVPMSAHFPLIKARPRISRLHPLVRPLIFEGVDQQLEPPVLSVRRAALLIRILASTATRDVSQTNLPAGSAAFGIYHAAEQALEESSRQKSRSILPGRSPRSTVDACRDVHGRLCLGKLKEVMGYIAKGELGHEWIRDPGTSQMLQMVFYQVRQRQGRDQRAIVDGTISEAYRILFLSCEGSRVTRTPASPLHLPS